MSSYSDWKCGAITDEEYKQEENYQARKDDYYQRKRIDEYYGCDCFDGDDEEDDEFWQ